MTDWKSIIIGATLGGTLMYFAKPFIDELLPMGEGEGLYPAGTGPRYISQKEEYRIAGERDIITKRMWDEAIAYNPRAYSGTASYNYFYGL